MFSTTDIIELTVPLKCFFIIEGYGGNSENNQLFAWALDVKAMPKMK